MKKQIPKPINFGERMRALKWAKQKLSKDKALADESFRPIDPLDTKIQAYLTVKPLEVTVPTPLPTQQIAVKVSTAMERAIESLRGLANGPH